MRSIHEIYHSRVDVIDFWLILFILSTSLVCFISEPIENIPNVYVNIKNITSINFGLYLGFVGIINLIRLFLNKRNNTIVQCFLKSLMLSCFVFLLFGFIGNSILPLSTGILSIIVVLSIDNIIRS